MLASGSTALAVALRIERRDGAVFSVTNIRRTTSLPAFTVRGVTVPAQSYLGGVFWPSNLVQSDSPDKVDNWEASLITGAHLPQDDIANGLFADAPYSLVIYDWREAQPIQLRARGWVGAPQVEGAKVVFKMRSLSQAFAGQILSVTSPLSWATWNDIQDGKCGFTFDPAADVLHDGHPAQIASAVDLVDGSWPRRRFTLGASTAHPARRFTDGRVRFTSGANAGFIAGVLDWDASTGIFTLDRDAPRSIEKGSTVTARVHAPLNLPEWRTYFGSGFGFAGQADIVTTEQAAQVNDND